MRAREPRWTALCFTQQCIAATKADGQENCCSQSVSLCAAAPDVIHWAPGESYQVSAGLALHLLKALLHSNL